MEKRSYVKPVLSGEEFVPQNYIAACGDSGVVYKFKCDAPEGTVYYYDADGEKHRVGGYSPCGGTHEAPSSDAFPSGFVDRNKNGEEKKKEKAIIWLEKVSWEDWWGNTHTSINNWHATTELDKSKWETAKS